MKVLEKILGAGLTVEADGDYLRVQPKHRLTEELRALIRANKARILAVLSLRETETATLVQELVETDGLTLAEAQAIAAGAASSRSTPEWLELIRQLDESIGRYCALCNQSPEQEQQLRSIRRRQPLASLPATLAWFRHEIARLSARKS